LKKSTSTMATESGRPVRLDRAHLRAKTRVELAAIGQLGEAVDVGEVPSIRRCRNHLHVEGHPRLQPRSA